MTETSGQGGELDVNILKCIPHPTEWVAQCPQCGMPIDVNMIEDDFGVFHCDDGFGNPFVECSDCGAVVEPTAVQTLAPPTGGER